MSATISIILDTHRIKKSNKYPVKLRVTFARVTESYQTIFDLSKADYDKLSASRISNELQTIRDKLKETERVAENTIKDIGSFSFADFENEFINTNAVLFRPRKLKPVLPSKNTSEFDYSSFNKKFPILLEDDSKPDTILFCYKNFIKKILREGRISSGIYYHCSYVSLKKFRGNVHFKEITVSFLYEYENWLTSKDISKTTIGMYLRPLRTIFNEAIEDGIIKKKNVIHLEDVGIKYDTLQKAVKQNRIKLPAPEPEAIKLHAQTKSGRTVTDDNTGMGKACYNSIERILASVAGGTPATIKFNEQTDLSCAGVLLSLPALLSNGLLAHSLDFKLDQVYYSEEMIFLCLAFLSLLRVKNINQVNTVPCGELGRAMGLDRIPEVKHCVNA